MRTKKGYVNIDRVYDMNQEYSNLGVDCAYRSIQIQAKTNLDINFGVVICKRNITKNPNFDNLGNGYVLPYAWHVWNECDNNIYDSEVGLTYFGIDVSKVGNVMVIEVPKMKNSQQFEKYLKTLTKSFSPVNAPSMIYLCGYGFDRNGNLINENKFNEMLDEADETYNITGSTETISVKYV